MKGDPFYISFLVGVGFIVGFHFFAGYQCKKLGGEMISIAICQVKVTP